MTNLIDVHILKIENPGSYWAKEAPGQHMTKEAAQFQEMITQMNDHFNDEDIVTVPLTQPRCGQICIGRRSSDKKWYRVRVQNVLQGSKGSIAVCFLVDYAEKESISSLLLREAPSFFLDVPHQAKLFKLDGIQPLTMVTDPVHMTTTLQPTSTWDTSAEIFIKKLHKEATHRQAEIKHVNKNKEVLVRMFMNLPTEGNVCLNDLLVEKQYATYLKEINGLESVESHSSLQLITSPQRKNLHSVSPSMSSSQVKTQATFKHKETHSGSGSEQETKEFKVPDIKFVPAGKKNLRPKKVKIPSPENPPELSGMLQSPVNVHPVAVKPAGRAASILSILNSEKKLGAGSARPDVLSKTLNTSVNGRSTNKKEFVVHKENLLESLEKIPTKQNDLSDKQRPNGILQSPDRSNFDKGGSGDHKDIQPASFGRGRQFLNALNEGKVRLPKSSTEYQPSNSDRFEDSNDDISFSPKQCEQTQLKQDKAPESTEQARPRTPGNVHFSDVDKVLEPRPGTTPPSSLVQPPRSILKKSPSVESRDDDNSDGIDGKGTSELVEWQLDNMWSGSGSDSQNEPAIPFKPRGVLDGNDLLERLKCNPSQMYDKTPSMVEEHVNPDNDKVIYLGLTKPKPVYKSEDLPYANLVSLVVPNEKRLNKLAKYCLNPIQRGLNVVGVSKKNIWNMLTYLFPVVYQLQQKFTYKDLPKGFGPMFLIVSPSWKKSRTIHDWCKRIAKTASGDSTNSVNLRTKVIFGGDADDSVEINLVNGCEILIATPDCLLRMLDREATSLNRVCHLVFEDADILTEQFTKQIKQIMDIYLRSQGQVERSAPKQVLAIGNCWNTSLSAFCRFYIPGHTIVITPPTEAAIFGRVNMVQFLCEENMRADRLIGLLDGTVPLEGKTIVFCNSRVQAENLYKTFCSRSMYAMLAHEQMNDIELGEVEKEWKRVHSSGPPPLLVTTDDVLNYIGNITDASTVIHYDSPMVKGNWTMGSRLWCMRNFFVNPVENKKSQSECQSYLLITDNLGPEAQSLVSFLERMYKKVPEALRRTAERHMHRVEKGKSNQLCEYMKAFGKCRDEKLCKFRHVVFRHLDSPGISPLHQKLPKQGEIKILITHVKNGSCYYGRLLEHTQNGTKIGLNRPYFKLATQMSMHYGVAERSEKCGVPERGKLYAIEDIRHTFHRVEIKDLGPIGNHGIPERAIVFYLDTGLTETVNTCNLFELPEELCSFPFQAVEVISCRVKPVDNDIEWTDRACAFMSDLIYNKTLDGTILLSMGNTLWLDPLVERENLTEVKVVNTLYNVKSQLQINNFGEENNQHLHLLYSACEGRLNLPEGLYNPEHSATRAYTVYGKPLELVVESLPVQDNSIGSQEVWGDDFIPVYVSAVSTPDLIYLQLGKRQNQWLDLQDDINTYIKLSETQCIEDLKKGTLVLAKFPLEEIDSLSWYRGKVMDILEDNTLEILFVDTGETEFVSKDHIQPLITRFLHLPFQAMECGIVNLVPIADDWNEEVSDYIWDFTRTLGDNPGPKPVYCKVTNHTTARHTGKYMYGVELYDASKEYNINIGAHMVARGMVKISSEYIDQLFPVMSKNITASYCKVPVICATMMRLPEPEVRRKLALEILQVVQENSNDKASEMGENGVTACLFYLIQYDWDQTVIETVCNLLVMLAMKGESNICLIEDRLDVLCEILEHCDNPIALEAVLVTVSSLAAFDRCRYVMLDKGAVRILSHVLSSSQSSQTKEMCLKTLNDLVIDLPQRFLSSIVKGGCIEKASKCVRDLCEEDSQMIQTHSYNVVWSCVKLFETLAKHSGLRDCLRKQGAVKEVCALLGDPDTEVELLDLCIRTLDLLSSNNRYNKDKMYEMAMPQVLTRLVQSEGLSDDTKSICHSLVGRLEAMKRSQLKTDTVNHGGIQISQRMPKQIKVQGILLKCPQIPLRRTNADTLWAQSKWNILLSIQVAGVLSEDRVASFTPHAVKFHAVSDATEYLLELDLYELIIPEKCQIQICSSQVRLGLRKSNKGRWPRLTKLKHKLPYLKVDYDRFIDSSDSESELDDQSSKEEEVEEPLLLAQRNNQRYVPFSKVGDSSEKRTVDFNPELLDNEDDSKSGSDSLEDDLSRPYRGDDDREYFML